MIDCNTPEVVSINIPVVNDDCVIATSWNSEHDSLAVAYQSGKVMVYCINYATFNLILLAEDNPEHKGEQSVYLGWGDVKKQFKGKAVASYLKESHPPESTYKHLSQDAFISWQVGERFFLVNSQLANERVIRIFDNECRLFYTITNMKVPGLCSKTAFRPKHNTLATVCKSDDSTSYIVMHERNGEYYNTIFPSSNGNVQDIQFSTCGRIFTILSYSKEKYFLDVYMQSNFIWLHKFRFTEETEKLMIAFRLNQTIEDTYSIEMIYYDCVAIYELVQVVTSVEDCHRVYVHIGNSLQEFDYKKSVIPPCGVIDSILNTNEPINNVVAHENILILIDSQEVAHVYRKRDEKWQEDHPINLKLKSNNLPVTWTKYLLSVIDDTDCLMAIGFVNNTCMKRIVRLDGDKNNDHQEVTENVNYAYKTSNSNIINVISADAYRTSSIQSVFNFSELKVDCVLLQNGELYINQKCFAKGVTSVLNYTELYLLITITCYDDPMDRMYCITVERLLTQSLPPINEISWSRRIEKGTILICMADDDGSVILEMPRGNIELVTVRPIILRKRPRLPLMEVL
ncbi:uncharacterized protein [Atheta coriaria]|uniref:uncharacterized protein n=1 Tax=Dalotia coriaria TaxID=877792 RepID=UPI0031F3B342